MPKLFHCLALTAALQIIGPVGLAVAEEPHPVLRIVYFIPTDRQPEPDYRDRLERVLAEVRRFYREGMERQGHGPLTFELDRDDAKALRVFEVRGKEPMRAYGRNAGGKVRDEVKAALAQQGIDIDRETVILFQLLLTWQGDRAIEIGPFVGGGDAAGGTAWVYDDAKLDTRLLSSKLPGGYYGGPCSLGQFNTHYIGGIAHELGHALPLGMRFAWASNGKASSLAMACKTATTVRSRSSSKATAKSFFAHRAFLIMNCVSRRST